MLKVAFALALSLLAALPVMELDTSDDLTFSVVGTFSLPVGAEITDATHDGRYLVVTDQSLKKAGLVDLTDPAAPAMVCEFPVPAGAAPTSVAVHPSDRYAVVTAKQDPAPGMALAFSIPGCDALWQVQLGIGPDAVAITPNGRLAVVAIEDEESEVTNPAACPVTNTRPGRVDIIELPAGSGSPAVTPVAVSLAGVAGVNCPSDPQPESLAISPDSKLAYVTLEENNALATIGLDATPSTLSVIALGTTSHLSDTTQDGLAMVDDDFTGRREPDGIAISRNGAWLFAADEGDTSRTGTCNVPGTVYSGGRTMTVISAANAAGVNLEPPAVAGDTGPDMDLLAAAAGALPNGRVCARGPEPEMVTTFMAAGGEYAAVTLERANGLAIFGISDPEDPDPVTFIPTGVGAEGVSYLPARHLLIVSNEVAGTITVICVQAGQAACH